MVRAIGKGKEPRKECPNIFLEAKINNAVPNNYDDTVFCAQNANEREASCEGDSGKYLEVNLLTDRVGQSQSTHGCSLSYFMFCCHFHIIKTKNFGTFASRLLATFLKNIA